MLLRLIYDDVLAQAAYLIGCQRTGEAVIFDPERDIDRYLTLARKEGVRIVAAAETHIHADFLSGVREFAELGARAFVSGEGGADWNCRWKDKKSGEGRYDVVELRHGATFRIGNIEIKALHTPGHTPEHMSYLVTDRGGHADEPMGVVTGDFVFVGDVGRPDLLETAAGVAGVKEPSAKALFASVGEFLKLPEYMQVWPAHGAGSACGKALGAVPQSTVGYEKRFNPSIRAADGGEAAFVRAILAGQPEPPTYFARMKRENRDGPAVLGRLPSPQALSGDELAKRDLAGKVVVDTRPWASFKAGHLPGAIFAPIDSMFINVVGGYIDPQQEIVLIAASDKLEQAVRLLVRIGLDRVTAAIDPSQVEAYARAGGELVTTPEIDVREAARKVNDPQTFVLDVRGEGEFAEGHLPGATNIAYTRLSAELAKVPKDKQIIVNCKAGGRSARAVSYLQRLGYHATNIEGGWMAWEQAHGAG
ncbi:MAG: MBL fold metallo-hydrolase [Phycisphaeraceae bacterium]|nr:MBL fold metallo-hydrolase [Phycisphaeraceae bacterium]